MEFTAAELDSAFGEVDASEVKLHDPTEAFGELRKLAEAYPEDGPHRAALEVLSNVAGMMLKPDRWDSPFVPMMRLGGRRTWLPEDLTEVQLDFLRRVRSQVPPGQFRAQLVDVLFLRVTGGRERYELAHEVVTAWIAVGLDGDLERGQANGWRRAIEVALRFGLSAEVSILTGLAMEQVRSARPASAWQSACALDESGAGREHAAEISQRLRELAATVEDVHFRREILSEARRWATTSQDASGVAEITEEVGDLWWEEAKRRRSSSHFLARECYGNAYNQYKRVERSRRSPRTNRRLARLPRKIREEGELALGEMSAIESDPIDLTVLRQQVDEVLKEEDCFLALASWFSRVPLDTVHQARESAEESIRTYPIQHLFSRTTVAPDGRTVQHSDSARGQGEIPGDVWSEMLRHWELKVAVLAQGYIWPTLVQLSTKHMLTPRDFALMVRSSPFIPPEQERHYVIALHNGYYGRLSESIFMLAPTIEACVRACLQRSGIETRNHRSDDTEIEPGLSALMELEGVDDALTPDLAWNIRALYCGQLGPNLRNRVAHGLLNGSESSSGYVLFAWWLALRLAFMPFFNHVMDNSGQAKGRNKAEEESEHAPASPLDDFAR